MMLMNSKYLSRVKVGLSVLERGQQCVDLCGSCLCRLWGKYVQYRSGCRCISALVGKTGEAENKCDLGYGVKEGTWQNVFRYGRRSSTVNESCLHTFLHE